MDVIVLARGGGSFEDLLPFSDERLVRAVAGCSVPIVSAVGHEQDTPLTDLAADVRASTPSVAARLVVPDADELRERLEQTVGRLRRAPLLTVERKRARLEGAHGRLRALAPQATLERGYAIVRLEGRIVRAAGDLSTGNQVDVELGAGGFGATVDETRE
jgi:exodeoxyribonuclease VII large subunit